MLNEVQEEVVRNDATGETHRRLIVARPGLPVIIFTNEKCNLDTVRKLGHLLIISPTYEDFQRNVEESGRKLSEVNFCGNCW